MKIGMLIITYCNDCPGFKWAGESLISGDCGFYCAFGAYSSVDKSQKHIPENCPFRLEKIQKENMVKIFQGIENTVKADYQANEKLHRIRIFCAQVLRD